jgi:hypothetical protein
MKKTSVSAFLALAAICMNGLLTPARAQSNSAAGAKSQACTNDDSGLTLPAGFCATVFAEGVGGELLESRGNRRLV